MPCERDHIPRPAVSSAWQGQGIDAGLLKDVIRRTLQAAEIAGIRAFAVNDKDARARDFFAYFGFIPSPTDPLHLYLLITRNSESLPGAGFRTRLPVRSTETAWASSRH
jgi:N-acetylglutamate synthase-like GNAT family acetyltransferase